MLFLSALFVMFSNKVYLGYYFLVFNAGPEFLITHPSVDVNEYGYNLRPSSLRDKVVNYIIECSGFIFFKPWFLYTLWGVFLILFHLRGQVPLIISMLILSGFLYLLGLIFLGNASDARLIFYSTVAFYFSTFVMFFQESKGKKT